MDKKTIINTKVSKIISLFIGQLKLKEWKSSLKEKTIDNIPNKL